MAGHPRTPWPRLQTVQRTGGSLLPYLAAVYPPLAVPSGGIDSCVATAGLTLITAPDGRELICVRERRYIVLCLNPANGQVVDMVVDPRGE